MRHVHCFMYYNGFISNKRQCNSFKVKTFIYFPFALKLKYRLYDDMGNKLLRYIAAIFLRISLMIIADQGNVIKVARNKKALWEKKCHQGIFFKTNGVIFSCYIVYVARHSKTLRISDCGKRFSCKQRTLTAEKTLCYPIFHNSAKD
jgi:hypothetical protein